jgi:hypothetical protein
LDHAQTILIPNHHTYPLPSLKTDEGRFVSVFENRHGQQLILIVDKTAKTGQFAAGLSEWRIENISSNNIMPNYFFDESELAWYTACWMSILKMPMGEVASLCRPGAKPLQTGHYWVSDDLIRKAKSGSPDTPEFGSPTDPASNLQLTGICVNAIKNLGLETVADVDSCSDLNLLKQYGISRVRVIQIRTEINRYLRRRTARRKRQF